MDSLVRSHKASLCPRVKPQLSLGLSCCLWENWGVAGSASTSSLRPRGETSRRADPSKPLSVYVCAAALANGSSRCLSSKKTPDKLTAPAWPASALCFFFLPSCGLSYPCHIKPPGIWRPEWCFKCRWNVFIFSFLLLATQLVWQI